jgi:hypothetical protein
MTDLAVTVFAYQHHSHLPQSLVTAQLFETLLDMDTDTDVMHKLMGNGVEVGVPALGDQSLDLPRKPTSS